VADLKPDVERQGWQREIRRLKREASYLTAWMVEEPASLRSGGIQASGLPSPPRLLKGRLFDRYVNLREALRFGDESSTRCSVGISARQDQDVVILLGFDERIRVRLNGEEVFSGRSRIAVADEFRIPVRLKKGENQLRLTIENRKLAWGFFLRLADKDGNPIEGLAIQPGKE
jgi:hypothetical protein